MSQVAQFIADRCHSFLTTKNFPTLAGTTKVQTFLVIGNTAFYVIQDANMFQPTHDAIHRTE